MFCLCLAEAAGGVGLGLAAAAVVFEELGRALVPGPLVATHLAAGLVDGAADGTVVVGWSSVPAGAVGGVLPPRRRAPRRLDVLLVVADRRHRPPSTPPPSRPPRSPGPSTR